MTKTYIFCILVSLFSYGFSQTIVTVDRPNIVGPTQTDHVTSVSSSGFVRGSGVNLSSANANFTSNDWTVGGDQPTAAANDDYIEWSISANTAFEITLDELDIRLRRNPNGPSDFQIFYSLDGFATTGTSLDGSRTLAENSNTNINLASLSVLSGISGTITFRLYAWGASSSGGILRVLPNAAWSISGVVPSPGLRLVGSASTSSTNSADSDIIASTFPLFPVQQNIDYNSTYITPSGLNLSNSVPLGAFTIRDGGIGTDTDSDGTTLTSIEFDVDKYENLAALAILDLGTFTIISEVTTVTEFTTFNGLNLTAADNSSRQFLILGSFKSVVTDNEQLQLTITNAITLASGSSLFGLNNAGGAQTSIVGDDNRIEVIASKFEFVQQPTNGNQNEPITPFPTIIAVDVNSNLDLDANITGISVTASPSSSIVPETYNMVNGEATLDNVVFTGTVSGVSINASASDISGTSNVFNINGPLLAIAEQNFDTATGWTYITNTAPFGTITDWGDTIGYFGEIALADASPLDNILFSGDIFGENDLNDDGNSFATLTFSDIDVTGRTDIRIEFDWQVIGYLNNANDIQYRLVLNGSTSGGWVSVFNGVSGDDSNDNDQGRAKIIIPDGNSTVGLQVRLRNNLASGYSGFDNFRLVSQFSGLIYTNAGGWKDNIKPDTTTGALNALVIDGTYNVDNNANINNLIINDGAFTAIDFGKSITTTNNVINEGSLILNSISNSYSSLIVNGSILNEVTYNRHVNQVADTGSTSGNNDLISAPVTNASQTFLALRTVNTEIPSGVISGVPSFLFGPFNNNTNAYVNYSAADDASVITSGIGYRTASDTPTGSTFEFVGDVETGSVSVPITVGSSSTFNLIGNPYPSYLSLSEFLSNNGANFSLSSYGVYGYTGELSVFTVWNQAYSDANPSAKLAPGQGFFVSSKTGGATIAFTPAMRRTGTSDDFISGRSQNQNLAHLNIEVAKENGAYQTALYFNDNATLSMDPGYDSELFEANTPAFSIYSRLVEDNLGKDMAAQSVSYSDLDNVAIPLGINITQGEQAVVSIAEHNIPEGTTVILEDNVANTFTNLLEGDYTFTPATTLNTTGRFYLHFGQSTLGVNDNLLNGLEIFVNTSPKSIVVKGQLEGQTAFKLFDIQGRLVTTQSLNFNNTEHNIDASNLTAGIYVVQLQHTTGNRTQKVIVR
ncbi:putative secreted protein (Por secretion system target) [Winogradskyella pacifica]|uniref:Putative secreted protein (Por secretion system target) n=1 Tax=Winogradskyella pacifica TaxID=664642 RepID=A0A3D9N5R1_9FLAO|nr:T9SS type A sorting domain-containing protein [Winogradskyella pacifica]REE27463.1 putative secreted protein (Por secretion system target) [Winogradskyella pacifica]